MTILYRLAQYPDIEPVRAFFRRNITRDNDAAWNEEFFCPLGVKAAIQRKQMFLAVEGRHIAGAVRFYLKKNGEFSVYQFAVEEEFRGGGLARAMFDAVRAGKPMRTLCPAGCGLNAYYEKTGWHLESCDGKLNTWILS